MKITDSAVRQFEPGDFERRRCVSCGNLMPKEMTGMYRSQQFHDGPALPLCNEPCAGLAEKDPLVRAVRISD